MAIPKLLSTFLIYLLIFSTIATSANDQKNKIEVDEAIVAPSEVFLEINSKDLKHFSEKFQLSFFHEISKLLLVEIDTSFPIKNIASYSWRSTLPNNSADKSNSIVLIMSDTEINAPNVSQYFVDKLNGESTVFSSFDCTKTIIKSKLTENKNALTIVNLNKNEILIGSPALLNDWNQKTDKSIFNNFKKEKSFIFLNITPKELSKQYFGKLSELELKKGHLKSYNLYQLISSSSSIEISASVDKKNLRILFNVKYDINDNAETLTALLYSFLNYSGVSASSVDKSNFLKISQDNAKKLTQVEVLLTIEQANKLIR